MKTRIILLLFMFFASCFFQSGFCANYLSACQKVPDVYKELVKNLISDGFEKGFVCKIFSDKRIKFNPKVMPRKVTHKEAKLHYDIFLERERIDRARAFLKENKILFASVERDFGVPREIKAAILLVETDLGRYLGSSLAINTLSSMVVAKDFNAIRPYLPKEYNQLKSAQRKKIEKKLAKKSRWAYLELKSLLIYSQLNKMDIFSIKGSIFGAIGLCQFMPSNALKFGVDYNKDGKVDLFDPADALASMANYLRYYGWKDGLKFKGKLKVIKQYNHSTPYAKTVIKVAERIGSS